MKSLIFLSLMVICILGAPPPINYPVRLTYVNSFNVSYWADPALIAKGVGIPGYAENHTYNYIVYAFWTYNAPLDIAKMWDDPQSYFFGEFGNTKE